MVPFSGAGTNHSIGPDCSLRYRKRDLKSRAAAYLVAATSKAEVDAGGITKVVLVAVGECIAEISQQVVEFAWPDGNALVKRDVDAATKRHGERIAGGSLRETACACNWLADLFERIAVHVGMRRAKEDVPEGLEVMRPHLDLGTKQIGKQIALDSAGCTPREEDVGRNHEARGVAAVALQVRL